jgi:heterodisulfide reductase subunit D
MKIEKFRDKIFTCNRTRCGICVGDCPEYGEMGIEVGASRGKMSALRGILENSFEPSERLAEIFYKCFLCGYCSVRCALDNHEIFEAFRADLVDLGLAPEVFNKAVDLVCKKENPYGSEKKDKANWAEDLNLPTKGDTLLFMGCTEGLALPETAVTKALILKEADVPFAYAGEDEPCCALALHEWGFLETFEEKAKKNSEWFKERNVKQIVTSCPYCTYAFDVTYPEIGGFDVKAIHMVPMISSLLNEGKISLKNRLDATVTYHDPCHLARYQNIIEEPRSILEHIPGLELVEMKRNRLQSFCCGGGGSVRAVDYDFTSNVSKKRVIEAVETGADILTTSCPFCVRMLSGAAKELGSPIKVLDLAELVAMSMGIIKP